MLQQVIFILVLLAGVLLAVRSYRKVIANIKLGKAEEITGDAGKRWKNVTLIALGQKKMFKNMLPAVFHLFIYVAFLFTQIELIEIVIDGLFGVHRFFADKIGILYPILINFIEILSLLAFIATVIFLARRNILKVARFQKPEMTKWPTLDANLILFGEILLIIGIFTMNGADVVLQSIDPEHYPSTGALLISDQLGPALFGALDPETLVVLERAGWWLHFLVVLAFLNYLPISKHLHILLAFPNAYYARLEPTGKMLNMPEIQAEVGSMLGFTEGATDTDMMSEEIPEFGAKDIFDLSWKTILDAYTCTECGRCTAQCPANLTGKKLSPRKVMMDIRDRTEEVATKLSSKSAEYLKEGTAEGMKPGRDNFDDGRSLFDYISREEIRACTSCNACVEACPVLINPLAPILELRRYEILTESTGPSDWMPMFNSLENAGSVWQMAEARDAWTAGDGA